MKIMCRVCNKADKMFRGTKGFLFCCLAALTVISWARAEVPGVELVMSIGEAFEAEPETYFGTLYQVQFSAAGHVVAYIKLTGEEVTTENEVAVMYKAPDSPPQIILREGDPVLDFEGETRVVTQIREASVDQYGNVAARVELNHPAAGKRWAILKGPASNLEVIAYAGMGVDGMTLAPPLAPMLTSGGRLLYRAALNSTMGTFWSDRPSEESKVITAGVTYPGMPAGSTFKDVAADFGHNDAGAVFFYGHGGLKVADGWWRYAGGTMTSVLAKDAPAPELPGLSATSAAQRIWLAEDGWMALQAVLTGTGVDNDNSRVIYAGFGDTLRLVVRAGSPAPGTADSTFGRYFTVHGLSRGGRLLIENQLRLSSGTTAYGLWLWDNGQLRKLVQVGQPVTPGGSQSPYSITGAGISPDGRAAFTTWLDNPNSYAAWIVDGTADPQRLLATGDAMPLPDGSEGSIRVIEFVETAGGQRLDARGRFLAWLTPEGSTVRSLAWVDPNAILPLPSGSISGTVYKDTDQDQTFSSGDEGLAGATIGLYYDDGTGQPFGERLASAETAADGTYAFPDLEAADYILIETNLLGYESVRDTHGINDDRILLTLAAGQASEGNNFLDRLPPSPKTVTITFHRVTPEAVDVQNLDEGKSNIDAPVVPVTDRSQLRQLPKVRKGLVADGVTPLIIRATFDPQELPASRPIRFEMDYGGASPKSGSFLILTEGWANSTSPILVSSDRPEAFALLGNADGLSFDTNALEATISVQVRDVLSDDLLASNGCALRHPPVALVHDYNSKGNWGKAFQEGLASPGRPFNPTNASDSFVRTIRYGQSEFWESGILLGRTSNPSSKGGVVHRENTYLPLQALVPMLDDALRQDLATLRQDWAVTRYDVVGHGQGGVLARMLASSKGHTGMHPGFRSVENFYRGRFRKVVTLGAPHNGSRLFAYLRALDRNSEFVKDRRTPESIIALGIFSSSVQDKFDPFGGQIRALNDPSETNPWKPDPSARFFRVGGFVRNYSILEKSLGLDPVRPAIYPRDSDGLVDLGSAMASTNTAAPHAYGIWPAVHSAPKVIFDPKDETLILNESLSVARVVSGALDYLTEELAFGPFEVPVPLDSSTGQMITNAAIDALIMNWVTVNAPIVSNGPPALVARRGPRDDGGGAGETIARYHLEALDRLEGSDVAWFAEAFGTNGVTCDALVVEPVATNSTYVDLTLPADLLGDVVLYASYTLTNGGTAFAQPALALEQDPPGAGISEIAVIPLGGQFPVGEIIRPQLWVAYTDGTVMQRYVTADSLTVVSSDPAVVNVAEPLAWDLAQPGQATILAGYRGASTSGTLTVQPKMTDFSRLWITDWTLDASGLSVTVPVWDDSELTLWRTSALVGDTWSLVEDVSVTWPDPETAILRDPSPAPAPTFYRVMAATQ